MTIDWDKLVSDFPILNRDVNGHPLVYLDNSATSLTPEPVIAAMDNYYRQHNANVHRGIHTLSMEATGAYEEARDKITRFIGAENREGVLFTRGATDSLNTIARMLEPKVSAGDVIVTTRLEHHANLIPWQQLAKRTGASLRFIELTPDGTLDLDGLDSLITPEVKIVAFAHVSNVLGGVADVPRLVAAAKRVGAFTVLDAAQSAGHMPFNFQSLDVDFAAFSSHKMLGPTGFGVIVSRPKLLASLEPVEFGGDMIVHVGWEEASWNVLPYKFEAGTPAIAEAIGLGAACDYLQSVGMEAIRDHTLRLSELCAKTLADMDGVTVFGPLTNRLGPVSFAVAGVHPHDVATILDAEGVAVRAGHHCAQPLHGLLGVPATARASFYLTNREQDIDRLVAAIKVVQKVFGRCTTTSTKK